MDCQHEWTDHEWTDSQPCALCGMPWSEVYALVYLRHPDGSTSVGCEPIEDQPHPSRLLP